MFVRPDVAAVEVRQCVVTGDGQHSEGSPLYVMAKEGDRWRVVAGQYTLGARHLNGAVAFHT